MNATAIPMTLALDRCDFMKRARKERSCKSDESQYQREQGARIVYKRNDGHQWNVKPEDHQCDCVDLSCVLLFEFSLFFRKDNVIKDRITHEILPFRQFCDSHFVTVCRMANDRNTSCRTKADHKLDVGLLGNAK